MPVLDYKELTSAQGAPAGENFEGLIRAIGEQLGLRPEWSGRGADQGRDLYLVETRRGVIGHKDILWLVSCKDNAKSGRAVTEQDVGSILDKLTQHKAQGFLLATTTTASTGLKALLDSITSAGRYETRVWDRTDIEGMLLGDNFESITKAFFPISYAEYRRLDSLPLALKALESNLPAAIFSKILSVIQTYQVEETWLTGERIWPYDRQSASVVDRALAAMLEKGAFVAAAKELSNGEIEFDAYAAALAVLATVKPAETQRLLRELIKIGDNEGSALYAYRFLLEHFDVSNDEQIELATSLSADDLRELFSDEASHQINIQIVINPARFSAWGDLDALSSQTRVEDATVDDVEFAVSDDRQSINFKASITVGVELIYDHETFSSQSFPGSAQGYINAEGIYVDDVDVDTGSFYE